MKSIKSPILCSPARGWSNDLSHPGDPPLIAPDVALLPNSPNHIDEIYLELARSTLRMRGVGVLLAFPLALLSIVSLLMLVHHILTDGKVSALLILGFIATSFTMSYLSAYMWRMETCPPRDEPIRFNRPRRKVYVYRFYHDAFRLFSRKAWYSRAEVYNWDDLRAEACEVYGPMGSGGLIQSVTLAVVKPGTNQVMDRFHFAHGGLEGEMYWTLAKLYMQQGAAALPEFEYLPRDWNNEDVTLNLARYLAPKVKWPEAMDLESRTAP